MKKEINTYTRPLLIPALICCSFFIGISSGAARAEAVEKQTETETEALVEVTASTPDIVIKPFGSDAERRLLKELLRLKIRYGEGFTFAMKLPETPPSGLMPETVSDTSSLLRPSVLPSLSACRILADCPLPKQAKTIQTLEMRLNALIEAYSGNWSVYTKNLTTEESFVIQDVPMKSASVMKLFILGTVYEAISNQELERTSEITDLMTNMICDSSNEASNRLLALLGSGSYADGIEKVNSYISLHGYSSLTHEYNGFDNSDTICDPNHFNQVSARDCGIFLERVYHRQLASRRICNEIEAVMLNQHTRYKIPAGLPEGVEAGNKTGEMDTVENDAAIIYGDYSDYILCVLSNDWNSKDEAISHIQEISSVVYDFFNDASYYQDPEDDSFTQLARLLETERYRICEAEDGSQYVVVSGEPEEGLEYVIVPGSGENQTEYVMVPRSAEDLYGQITDLRSEEDLYGYIIDLRNREESESESETAKDPETVLPSGESPETELSSEEAALPMDQAFPLLKESGFETAE